MGVVRKFLGPRSKYDKSLPHAYEARVDVLSGRGTEPMFNHYFSDTICGLIEYLDENGIKPADVQLFGVYRKTQIPLETRPCTDDSGAWLSRPELCRSLEEHFQNTLLERYKGHVEKGECSYEDRDRDSIGPAW
jgi:hypothetical protein